ncbi:hypothetical protein [Streptomyces sp. NPDC058731]|uniref:hypothetical protein n=1 Tax=Streptomyces sp. NPDC058731 TaxID=3346613 RepID=UPI0036B71D5A
MNGPLPKDDQTRPGRSAGGHVEASGQGRVYQAGRDQHIETHHHYPAGRIAVLMVGLAAVVLGVGTVVKFSADSTTGDDAGRQPARASITAHAKVDAVTPSADVSSDAASRPAQTPSPPADGKPFSGTYRLTYVDLDSSPPKVLSSNTGASFWINYRTVSDQRADEMYGLGGGSFTTEPSIAQWSEATEPTRQKCSDLIAAQGAETLPVSPGSRYCVKSGKGRIAVVTVGAFDQTTGDYKGTIRVWGPAS